MWGWFVWGGGVGGWEGDVEGDDDVTDGGGDEDELLRVVGDMVRESRVMSESLFGCMGWV